MVEVFKNFILETFGNLFGVFILSMSPILELRGAVPTGILFMGYPWWQVYIVSVLGNLVPVPFIVFFLRKVLNWMKRFKIFKKLAEKIESLGAKKAGKMTRGWKIGLYLFVALPLPGTGAWTAALIASMLDIRLKDCIVPITLGVLSSGVVMTVVSCSFDFLLNYI